MLTVASSGVHASLEGVDLRAAPVARDLEAVRRETEGPEHGQCAPLTVGRIAVALAGIGLRNDPAGQGPQRDAIEPGPGGGERIELQRLAHLLKESDRLIRGGVPLLCAPCLLRRWGVLAGLEVLRPMPTRLELGETAQTEALYDVLGDRRDGGRVGRRHQRVGTDSDQHPVAVGVEGHHPVGEAMDPRDSVVGVARSRAYEEVGLWAPRRRRAGADAAYVVDKGIEQDDYVVVALRGRDREHELLGASTALLPAEIQHRVEVQHRRVAGIRALVVPRRRRSGATERVDGCRQQLVVLRETVDELGRDPPDIRIRGPLLDLRGIGERRNRSDGYRGGNGARRDHTDRQDERDNTAMARKGSSHRYPAQLLDVRAKPRYIRRSRDCKNLGQPPKGAPSSPRR